MQIETDAIEKMAREYKAALAKHSTETMSSMEALVERAIIILEEQQDIINALLSYNRNRQAQRLLNYLKSLKSTSVVAFNKLLARGEYIPSFRNNDMPDRSCQRLVDLQINLFVLLDQMARAVDVTSLAVTENRVMSVMGLL